MCHCHAPHPGHLLPGLPAFGFESVFWALYPVASQAWASGSFCCKLAPDAFPMRESWEAGPDVFVPLAGLPHPAFARMTLG